MEESLIIGISYWGRGFGSGSINWSAPTKEEYMDYSKSVGFRLKVKER